MGRMREEFRPYVKDGPASIRSEVWHRVNLLYSMYILGALGVSMSPQQLQANAHLMNVILWHESPLSLHELPHNKVLETLHRWDVPGVSTLLEDTGIIEVGRRQHVGSCR